MRKNDQVILSISDCWQAIKQARWLILFSALLLGAVLFTYFLRKPPTFTAEGIFRGSVHNNATGITKALEFLGAGESYSSADDPKVFLHSYPVMDDVVRTLHLHATIREKKRGNLLSQLWNTLKAERAQRLLKNKRTDSPILNERVVSTPILSDQQCPLKCRELEYPGCISEELDLTFLDASHFQVTQKKEIIGQGTLNKPFHWKGGMFTLTSSESVEKKTFHLTFIPIDAAVKSLEKSLIVKRSKEQNSLVHVSFTHPDRHLANAIVNTAMDAFQKYLKAEGKRKISQQIGYLRQRQEETLSGLEEVMEEHKAYLEAHLEAGELFLLQNELEFMGEKQARARKERDQISESMQAIHQVLAGKHALTFPELLEKLRTQRPSQEPTLSLEGAYEILHEQEQMLEEVKLEQEQYDYCLTKLLEPEFDTSSLSKLVDDDTLTARFNKIHNLHRNLIDEKNWTTKERAQLQEELETERKFLIKHIHDLKKGASLKEDVLHTHLRELQGSILFLLLDRYEGLEAHLRDLARTISHFPQKWLAEQKIELNKALQIEIIESITKMIEAKNLGYHLDYISAAPLMQARLPMIPNSPHLFFGFLIGSFLGAFLVISTICLRELRLGPTASYTNLKGEGMPVISFTHTLEDLKNIHFHLKSKGPLLGIVLKNLSVAFELGLLFSKGGEKVLVVDLTQTAKKDTFTQTPYGQHLVLGIPKELKEVKLGSLEFRKMLEQQKKTYDRILLATSAPLDSLEVRVLLELANQSMLMLHDERCATLPPVPDGTLYVSEMRQKTPLSLTQIVPFLERLISFSFWNDSLKTNSQEPQQTETFSPLEI